MSNYVVFPGITRAVYELLSLSSHVLTNSEYTVSVFYKNPFHHIAVVRYLDKRISVYMDGNLLDPKQNISIIN